jgi:HlyD family secretion protein
MELSVDVDEADVGMVKNGQDATFTVDAYPNQTFKAKILQVKFGSTATEGVVTYETLLLVDNEELLLRPGMTATAEIIVNQIKDSILVPNASLRYEPPFAKNASSPEGGQRSFLSRLMPGPPGRFANQDQRKEKKKMALKRYGF